MLDHPNHRSSHKRSTPRGGGVVFVFVAALATVFELLFFGSGRAVLIGVVLLPLPLAIVGLLDDRHDISPVFRFGVQLATALLVTLFSPLPLPWFATPLVLIAFAAVINFTNFMDGLDGLVAGCMTLIIGALAIALDAPWSLWSCSCITAFLLELVSRQSLYGRCGQHFSWGSFCWFDFQALRPEAFLSPGCHPFACGCLSLCTPASVGSSSCVSSSPSPSLSALASGWLVTCKSILHLYVCNGSIGFCDALRWAELVIVFVSFCVVSWCLARSKSGSSFFIGV